MATTKKAVRKKPAFKVGDRVWVEATIEKFDEDDDEYPYRVDYPAAEWGSCWLRAEDLHPIPKSKKK